MAKRIRLWKLGLIMMLPFSILLLYSSSYVPGFVERAYSNAFFKLIGQIMSNITSILPFSLAEFITIFLVLFFAGTVINTSVRLVRLSNSRLAVLGAFLINAMVIASVLYTGFILLWGLNYSRLPFAAAARLEICPAPVNELAEMCQSLILKTNDLRAVVEEDSKGVMVLPRGKTEALKRADKGYIKAAEIYPELGGCFGNPKPVLLSQFMCYTGITGVYFPFTGEANVNILNNYSMIPSIACHEMAHQRGFAREEEANYIAYLTCRMHPDKDFQYSGHLLALIYSMNALYRYDMDKYTLLRSEYSEGIRRDLNDINTFWEKYEGPVEKISSSINNAYLKANMQNDGVYSYGRMVDLLLAEYRKEQK